MVDTEALLAIEDGEERYAKSFDAFNEYRTQLGAEVKQYLKAEGIAASDLSHLLGVDPGGLSRRFRSPFAVPMDRLTVFSYDFMKESCHALFFGQPATTRLPRLLSHVVTIMFNDDDARETVNSVAEQLYKQHREEGTLITSTMETVDIVRERLLEYSSDTFIPAKYICGTDAPVSLKTGLSNLAAGKKMFLRINTVMYYAMMANTTLDYFVAADYTRFTRVVLFNQPNVIVQDRFICRFIGRYLVLPQEAKAEVVRTALHAYWRS